MLALAFAHKPVFPLFMVVLVSLRFLPIKELASSIHLEKLAHLMIFAGDSRCLKHPLHDELIQLRLQLACAESCAILLMLEMDNRCVLLKRQRQGVHRIPFKSLREKRWQLISCCYGTLQQG